MKKAITVDLSIENIFQLEELLKQAHEKASELQAVLTAINSLELEVISQVNPSTS